MTTTNDHMHPFRTLPVLVPLIVGALSMQTRSEMPGHSCCRHRSTRSRGVVIHFIRTEDTDISGRSDSHRL